MEEDDSDLGEYIKAGKRYFTKLDIKDRIILTIIIIAVVIALAERQMGYQEGYTYVDGWYKEHIDRYCSCSEPTGYQEIVVMNSTDLLSGINITIS